MYLVQVSPSTLAAKEYINNDAINEGNHTVCTCRRASQTDCHGVHQHYYLQHISYIALQT